MAVCLFFTYDKNIVLDMGNVCCKWDVSYIASQLASSLEEKDYIIKHLFQTKQWAQLDRGFFL
ncbi:MAG: hypothetical protein ACLR43_10540 [Faecalibacillus faecis]